MYAVAVTETKRRLVSVEAVSEQEAHRRVYDAWQTGEVLLDEDCFEGVEVFVVGPTNEVEGLYSVERKG